MHYSVLCLFDTALSFSALSLNHSLTVVSYGRPFSVYFPQIPRGAALPHIAWGSCSAHNNINVTTTWRVFTSYLARCGAGKANEEYAVGNKPFFTKCYPFHFRLQSPPCLRTNGINRASAHRTRGRGTGCVFNLHNTLCKHTHH